ncbi:MAG: oligosaccharide flippase family protein [Nannocystaceae bacterium]|nr:oligosaccharide flippase family protein [Nannocystaceae bacterium]
MTVEDTQDPGGTDHRDLRRGAALNLLGNLFKLADPILLVAVAARYGTERFGLFYVAQAVTLLLLRVSLLGMDKALLWWVPQEKHRSPLPLLRRAAGWGLGASMTLVMLVMVFVGPEFMAAQGRPPEAALVLRLLVLSLPILVGIELLTHATMGTRSMRTNVIVKDMIAPVAFPGFALAFAATGRLEVGLSIAFLGSNLIALGAAAVGFHRCFRGRPKGTSSPPGIRRYAMPMWGAEISNSLLQRLDVLLIEALTGNFGLAGVWGIVTKLSNSLRAIRRSFDPIVAAIAAEPAVSPQRLAGVLSRASFLVSSLQVPVVVFLFVFAGEVLSLFGEGFELATTPLLILSAGWLVVSAVGLSGVALYARGHAVLHLLNVLLTIAALLAVGTVLIPRLDLVGAAIAVVAAYLFQAGLQALQLRRLAGVWGLDRVSAMPLVAGLVGLAFAAVSALATDLPLSTTPRRVVGYVSFAAAYGASLWALQRTRAHAAQASG